MRHGRVGRAPRRLTGRIDVGGQEHFYLEGQIGMAIPGEDGDMLVHSSTQHPTEVQHLVARSLKLSDHAVVCETRRMGGAFGGKESQASLIACAAALLAHLLKRPVKLQWLDRDDDMVIQTGKRHEFRIDYDVGFDGDRAAFSASASMQAGPLRLSPPICPARFATARCSTPITATTWITPTSFRIVAKQTLCPIPRSAASADRRA